MHQNEGLGDFASFHGFAVECWATSLQGARRLRCRVLHGFAALHGFAV